MSKIQKRQRTREEKKQEKGKRYLGEEERKPKHKQFLRRFFRTASAVGGAAILSCSIPCEKLLNSIRKKAI